MCLNTEPCAEPSMAGVWWRDDADWKQYDAPQAAAIQRGIADGASTVDLGYVVSSKHSHGARYEIDLRAMKQINLARGFTRDFKVVKSPATPAPAADDNASIKEELRICKQTVRSLENMVLKLEADLLALRVEVLDNKVKASVTRANQLVDNGLSFNARRASHGVSEDGVCELLERISPSNVNVRKEMSKIFELLLSINAE